MSFSIVDSAESMSSVASNGGMNDLEAFDLPALKDFLTTGTADAAQMEQLILETSAEPDLRYLAAILRGMTPPIVLTDGIVEDDEPESETT